MLFAVIVLRVDTLTIIIWCGGGYQWCKVCTLHYISCDLKFILETVFIIFIID